MKLELYYYSQCPFCQKVLRQIEHLGLQDKIILKNTLEDPSNRVFHMNKTGRTTVPCLYIDDSPMFESQDICDWLESNQKKL